MRFRWLVCLLCSVAVSCTASSLRPEQANALLTPSGRQYHWARNAFPIPVVLDPYTIRYDFVFALDEGIALINELVGTEVFYLTDQIPSEGEYVRVFQGDLGYSRFQPNKIKLGVCLNYLEYGIPALDGQLRYAEIYFNTKFLQPRYSEQTLAVAIHELLHALGLAHDVDDPDSIMYPEASIDRHIQPDDIEYIREQAGVRL